MKSRHVGVLDAKLRHALDVPIPTLRRVGVEHEYIVQRGGETVDFRRHIHRLGLAGGALDPGDPNAHRCEWGGVVTADGCEAEIASPPELLRPGFATRLDGWAHKGFEQLSTAMPRLELSGYSTHLSVEVPDRCAISVARRFVASFAVPTMLLLDNAESPGLLVRPRRGRLELCGDHLVGSQLRSAALFAAGATQVCVEGSGIERRDRLRSQIVPATGRFGFYVDRHAFGVDLYSAARVAPLQTRRGRTVTAQDVLTDSWSLVREHCARLGTAEEFSTLAAAIAGDAPLPVENRVAHANDGMASEFTHDPSPYGSIIVTRERPTCTVEAVAATWDFTLFGVRRPCDHRPHAVVCIPSRFLDRFLECLDTGSLDALLHDILTTSQDALPRLEDRSATQSVGVFAVENDARELLPAERDPRTGRLSDGGWRGGDRHQKDRSDDARRWPKLKRAQLAFAAIIIAVVAVAFAARSDSEAGQDALPDQVTPTLPTTVPGPLPTAPTTTAQATTTSTTTTAPVVRIYNSSTVVADVTGPPFMLDRFRQNIGLINDGWTVSITGDCATSCEVQVGGTARTVFAGVFQATRTGNAITTQRTMTLNQNCGRNDGSVFTTQAVWTVKYAFQTDAAGKILVGQAETTPEIDVLDVAGEACYLYRYVYNVTGTAP